MPSLPTALSLPVFSKVDCLPSYTRIKPIDGQVTNIAGGGNFTCSTEVGSGNWLNTRTLRLVGTFTPTVAITLDMGTPSLFLRMSLMLNGVQREYRDYYNVKRAIDMIYNLDNNYHTRLSKNALIEMISVEDTGIPCGAKLAIAAYNFVHYIDSALIGQSAENDYFPICFFDTLQMQFFLDTVQRAAVVQGVPKNGTTAGAITLADLNLMYDVCTPVGGLQGLIDSTYYTNSRPKYVLHSLGYYIFQQTLQTPVDVSTAITPTTNTLNGTIPCAYSSVKNVQFFTTIANPVDGIRNIAGFQGNFSAFYVTINGVSFPQIALDAITYPFLAYEMNSLNRGGKTGGNYIVPPTLLAARTGNAVWFPVKAADIATMFANISGNSVQGVYNYGYLKGAYDGNVTAPNLNNQGCTVITISFETPKMFDAFSSIGVSKQSSGVPVTGTNIVFRGTHTFYNVTVTGVVPAAPTTLTLVLNCLVIYDTWTYGDAGAINQAT